MIAFGHTSIGTIIGLSVATIFPGAPFWAKVIFVFFMAVASHYAFDWLPHGHYHVRFKNPNLKMLAIGLVDFLGFILFFTLLAYAVFGVGQEFWLILTGIAGAQAPDIWEALYEIGLVPQWRWVRIHRHFHSRVLHWHNRILAPHVRMGRPIQKSDIWQVAVFALAVLLITTSVPTA